jgi:signal transduction histidine kinase
MNDESKDFQVDSILVANFTHQIINPLNGVVGTLDNVIDGTITGHRKDQRLRVVRAQLEHVIELVRNLAFLSQLSTERGRQGLRESGGSCVVPELVIEAAMLFQEMAAERQMKIELEDPRTQYVVTGHRDLLRQVFTNLFENAVKYGQDNSVIDVVTRAQKRTQELIVEVHNKGAGFAYESREQLFERGFRGPEAKAVYASGSGLGLFICREILDAAFDARIEAEHSARTGTTTFRLRFPKYRIAESARSHVER